MRLLVLSFGHSLAHVTRPLEVAKLLRARGHEVRFAGCGRYLAVARQAGFEAIELPFIPEERMKEVMRSGRMGELYSESELESWITAERELFRKLRPDVLLVDTWVTASSSAELSGIPRVVIMNSHMSNLRAVPFLRRSGGVASIPDRIVNAALGPLERLFYDRFVVAKVNRVRRRLGLKARYSHSLEHGDLTLLADVPEFNPVSSLPEGFRFVGPLTWKNDLPAPQCLSRIEAGRKIIYVTIGSLGRAEWIRRLAEAAPPSWALVFATGDPEYRMEGEPLPNVHLETFVNADLLLPRCDAILCHGGNGTIYQALAHGVPIVGAAVHEEQYFGLKLAQSRGLGIGFEPKAGARLEPSECFRALRQVIEDPGYRQRARGFQRILAGWDAPKASADLIEQFISSG